MSTTIRVVELKEQTEFVPLAVLGYCLTRTNFLDPVFSELDLPIKTVDHAPSEKLLDLLVSILASCRSVVQVNTRIRPDRVLAQAWNRNRFAEQSSLMRTLDAFDPPALEQLRRGSETLFRRESRSLRHSFGQDWLWLDIDLTPLPTSKHAQGSTKGKMGEKTHTVANWPECMRLNIEKRFSRNCILAIPIVAQPTSRC